MNRPKRILFVTEFSQTTTGYASVAFELMSRLVKDPQFQLAELACNCAPNDPRIRDVPWHVFPNHQSPETNEFHSDPANKLGKWRFNQVCIDFKPDIVVTVRDIWFEEFVRTSPLRGHFKWLALCPVDSLPQREEWIASYVAADCVLAQSYWGLDVLTDICGGLANIGGVAPLGADLDLFKIMDKRSLRDRYRFDEDILICGFVARNQDRKRFPELMEGFRKFLDMAPIEIAKRSYLYLHTTYPDQGFNIPTLLKRYGLASRTLFSYKCINCHAVHPSFFQDAKTVCPNCNKIGLMFPNSNVGVNRNRLPEIYNLFDVYVQFASNEGCGIPVLEAAACGLPTIVTNYSAMTDFAKRLGSYPISAKHMHMLADMGTERAVPDPDQLAHTLLKVLSLPDGIRETMGRSSREGVTKDFNYDHSVVIWKQVIDSLPYSDTWSSPARLHTASPVPTDVFDDTESFIDYLFSGVLGRPELRSSYESVRVTRDLNWTMTVSGMGLSTAPYTPDMALAEFRARLAEFNHWEALRDASHQ